MKTIRSVMSPDPVSVEPECPIREALELLIEFEISGLPVVDASGAIVGILSERDLLRTFQAPAARTVAELMTKDVVSFSVDDPLVDLVDCIMASDFRRVLVHEGGRLAGVVSRADLMPVILELLRERHG